jgi:hypothetical protein
LVTRQARRCGFEFKYADAPTLSKSMHIALQDLKLQCLFVVFPGLNSFLMNEQVDVISLRDLPGKAPAIG